GFRGRDFYEGRKLWIKALLAGHKLLPLGGNDAHGDLNDYTAVKQPLWSLRCNSEHVFGQVRTVIPDNGKTPFSCVPKNLYITDGPALWFENGKLHAKSTKDFGEFLSITIFRGCEGKPNFEKREDMKIGDSYELEYEFEFEISLNNSLYVRAECETSCGKFAMTAAIYSSLAV
ncbi:MAG: hypothetical protein FWF63_08020, partial [Fibromonadales bacterium]|nr:hypothetical protein [Fibromonadales bacterium]